MARNRVLTAVALTASMTMLAACGADDTVAGEEGVEVAEGGDTTLTWWHNSNSDPGRAYYEEVAAAFEAENPGVTVEITPLAHEDMLTRLDASFQTGDAPDVFMERGGGELADHVDAGLLMNLTEDAGATIEQLGGAVQGWQVDGQTYALPFSLGVVGFWYNKDLFAEAGITEPPETMEELNAAVEALKAAGIQPISVGAGDKWPAAHYWYYAALRACDEDTLVEAIETNDFSAQCFITAGEALQEFIETEPFNEGFLATPAQTGPTSASGLLATEQVAMELAGHWEPGVVQGLTEGEGLGDTLGWFPFPAIEGGEGDPEAALGGGDAWACSAEADPACVDFVEYLLTDEVQAGFAENDMGLPTNPAASGAVANPVLADLLAFRDEAPFVQLYLDTAFGENVGGAMNDAIALMFAGEAGPEEIVEAIQTAADRG